MGSLKQVSLQWNVVVFIVMYHSQINCTGMDPFYYPPNTALQQIYFLWPVPLLNHNILLSSISLSRLTQPGSVISTICSLSTCPNTDYSRQTAFGYAHVGFHQVLPIKHNNELAMVSFILLPKGITCDLKFCLSQPPQSTCILLRRKADFCIVSRSAASRLLTYTEALLWGQGVGLIMFRIYIMCDPRPSYKAIQQRGVFFLAVLLRDSKI